MVHGSYVACRFSAQAGATLDATLSPAQVIIGIKETPLNEVLTDDVHGRARTHVMFSHTHKGQTYNAPLLSRFLSDGDSGSLLPKLVDWELSTDERGKRTVGFGWYAGGVSFSCPAVGTRF